MSELRRLLAENRLVARPRYHPPRHQPSMEAQEGIVVLDAAALLDITVANGSGPVPFVITAGEQTLKGQFNAKTLRRAAIAVREAGAENVAVVQRPARRQSPRRSRHCRAAAQAGGRAGVTGRDGNATRPITTAAERALARSLTRHWGGNGVGIRRRRRPNPG
jgi:hypothetical protein